MCWPSRRSTRLSLTTSQIGACSVLRTSYSRCHAAGLGRTSALTMDTMTFPVRLKGRSGNLVADLVLAAVGLLPPGLALGEERRPLNRPGPRLVPPERFAA